MGLKYKKLFGFKLESLNIAKFKIKYLNDLSVFTLKLYKLKNLKLNNCKLKTLKISQFRIKTFEIKKR